MYISGLEHARMLILSDYVLMASLNTIYKYYAEFDKSKHLCMLLTERTHLTMYIHMKSTYKIKVGHKNCVIALNSFDSDPLCYA